DALPTAGEVPQLALEVGLEPGAVLPLELLKLINVLLQRGALGVEAAHDLLVALARIALQRLGLGPGIAGHLVGLLPSIGQELVGLTASVRDVLVRGALGHHERPQRLLLAVAAARGAGAAAA